MSDKIIVIGKPINNSKDTRCPWCKATVPLWNVEGHKMGCPDRRPLVSIKTTAGIGFIANQCDMQ